MVLFVTLIICEWIFYFLDSCAAIEFRQFIVMKNETRKVCICAIFVSRQAGESGVHASAFSSAMIRDAK